MSDKTAIQWTDATWNPVTGCDRVSPGCAHCYALDLAARLKQMQPHRYKVDGDPKTSGPGFGMQMYPESLDQPLRWTRPRRIFVNSMSDLFHPEITVGFVSEIFATMAIAKRHTFQVLTKRPEIMSLLLRNPGFIEGVYRAIQARGHFPLTTVWPLRNVWLGVSVENQHWADVRIPLLLETPAAVQFLSCEPLLGPVDLSRWLGVEWMDALGEPHEEPSFRGEGGWGREMFAALRGDRPGVAWVIVGGESGSKHRSMDPAWAADLRDQCVTAGVPFFYKQLGGRTPKAGGRELDGRTWDEMPTVSA